LSVPTQEGGVSSIKPPCFHTPIMMTRPDVGVVKNKRKLSRFLEKPPFDYDLAPVGSITTNYATAERYFTVDYSAINYDRECLSKACIFLRNEFFPFMRSAVVLTQPQAILMLDSTTSSGYPWKMIGFPTKYLFISSDLSVDACDRDWQLCHSSDYSDTKIYTNFVKEEIRPGDKLRANKLRGVMCAPVDHVVTGLRLFADMNQKLYDSHIATSSAVGISSRRGTWDLLYKHLARFEKGFALDESGYDATLPPVLFDCIRDFRKECLPPEYGSMVDNYYRCIVYALVRFPDGCVYRKRGGNPSGSVNTISDNTLILFLLFSYAWIKTTGLGYEDFKRNVVCFLYGDDNTFTVSRDFIGIFNAKTVKQAFSDFGVVVKNTGPDLEPKEVSELDFLSTRFVRRNGYIVPFKDHEKDAVSMCYSEYPDDAFEQAKICINHYENNPFNPAHVNIVFSNLDRLYPHMTPYQVQTIKRSIKSLDYLWMEYTGCESCLPISCQGELIRGPFKNNYKMEVQSANTPKQTILVDSNPAHIRAGRKTIDMLSETGRQWLTRALDPFHDTLEKAAGYPDMDMSASVVQEVNLTMQISAPSTLPSGSNWDCHIFNLVDFAEGYGTSGLNWAYLIPTTMGLKSYVSSPGVTSIAPAGVVALSGAAGSALLPNMSGVATNLLAFSNVSASSYITGKCRCVAGGFEVINTTAPLYAQGLVTCYRMPQSFTPMFVQNVAPLQTGTGSSYDLTPALAVELPPGSVDKALVLPSSKQWDAKRGAYCVFTLATSEVPLLSFDSRTRLYLANNNPTSTQIPALAQAINPSSSSGNMGSYLSYFNTSGVYLTGLSPQTTLQVNVKYIVEAVPGQNNQLVTLAQPSPPYDPDALELYAHMVRHLPPGVPQDENPAGEWWKNVLATIGDLATSASAIHPLFGAAGTVLRGIPQVISHVQRIANGTDPVSKRTIEKVSQREKQIEAKLDSLAKRMETRKNNRRKKKKKKGSNTTSAVEVQKL
jgi:hypothetical protein